MRELTEAELAAKNEAWERNRDNVSTTTPRERWWFKTGFIAGLETQDGRIAELEAKIANLEMENRVLANSIYLRMSET